MGVYYYLLNDTDKKCLDFDAHVKQGPIRYNEAVHMAFVNYMFEHQGCSFRMVSDRGEAEEIYEYEELDLRKYSFEDEEITEAIKDKITKIEERGLELRTTPSLTATQVKPAPAQTAESKNIESAAS